MAGLYSKIKLYLEANSKTVSEFDTNIVLQDDTDGNGPYIKTWNVSGLAKPSNSDLSSHETNANKEESNGAVRGDRRKSYGKISDQLDMLYKDLVAGKLDATGEWAKMIKKVKDDNPKS